MARTYRRDARGRFSGGGGSSGGGKGGGSKAAPKSKGAMTKAADKARAADLKAKGTTGLGGRVKAKGFGGKKAKETAGGLRRSDRMMDAPTSRPNTISGKASVRAANAQKREKAAQRKASRAASKGTKKMAPAPANEAKTQYKKLRSEQRDADRKGMTAAFFGDKKGSKQYGAKKGAATRKLRTMEASRGVSKRKK
jgi:hypothetical protein